MSKDLVKEEEKEKKKRDILKNSNIGAEQNIDP
jgi:hypothetical protein